MTFLSACPGFLVSTVGLMEEKDLGWQPQGPGGAVLPQRPSKMRRFESLGPPWCHSKSFPATPGLLSSALPCTGSLVYTRKLLLQEDAGGTATDEAASKALGNYFVSGK